MLPSYSYSSLDTFHSCPRKFKFAYVDKVKTVPKITADTYLGNAVHRVLRQLYTLGADGIVMKLVDAVRMYQEEWDKLERAKIAVESQYYTVDDFIRIGKEMLTRHYEKYQPFKQGTLLGAELYLTFELPGTPFKFKGFIDRLWQRDDGMVEICDYKTGQHLSQPTDRRFVQQMGLYQLAVQTTYPQFDEVELAQYFLRRDAIVTHRLRPDELDMLTEQMRVAVVESIHATQTDDFPAKEGSHCVYCSYQNICPAKIHRRMLEDEEDEDKETGLTLKELADEYLRLYLESRRVGAELDGLKQQLVEAARKHEMSRFDGDRGAVSVALSSKKEFISKTRDEAAFADLSAVCRQLGLEEYFKLDGRILMKEVYQKKRLPDDQLEKLEPFVFDVERSRVTAKVTSEQEPDEGEE